MLEAFEGFETSDPEVNREILFANFDVRRFDCAVGERAFAARANWADTKYMRITSAGCTTSTDIDYAPSPGIRMFVSASTGTRIAFELGRSQTILSAETPTAIIPSETAFRGNGHQQHEVVALRIACEGLRTVASALLGEDVLLGRIIEERWHGPMDGMPLAVMQLASDLDGGLPSESFAQDLFAQSFLVRMLLVGSKEFGSRLRQDVASPSLYQLRRVEEFLAANWQRDVDVEQIADEFGISARSIFRYFRTLRGVTPKEFIEDIRLTRAIEMLRSAGPGDGVMTIALRCGFNGLGHFAKSYRAAFGELPSETLLIARAAKVVKE